MTMETQIAGFKALGHPLRFVILQSLVAGERNVGDIEIATGIAQPALSQQLAVLRKAGLVATRKKAKLVFYRLDTEKLAGMAAEIESLSRFSREETLPKSRATAGAAQFARID